MNRREVLKLTALVTGAAITPPLAGALLSGCSVEPKQVSHQATNSIFSKEEYQLLNTVVDVILPKTDSPSASEVGVPSIIDDMVGQVYDNDSRQLYVARFQLMSDHLGDEFAKSTIKNKTEKLQALGASTDEALAEARMAYLDLRQQTVAFYLTTEPVATKFLNFLPVPGEYQPCIELSSVNGKAWAI
jgi:hypothetical protein